MKRDAGASRVVLQLPQLAFRPRERCEVQCNVQRCIWSVESIGPFARRSTMSASCCAADCWWLCLLLIRCLAAAYPLPAVARPLHFAAGRCDVLLRLPAVLLVVLPAVVALLSAATTGCFDEQRVDLCRHPAHRLHFFAARCSPDGCGSLPTLREQAALLLSCSFALAYELRTS
jgi:hypothetical protein